MRKCRHCPYEGPDHTFAYYKDKAGEQRTLNTCLTCHRARARERQAKYKERNLEQVRKRQREARYDRYHTDPEFRQRCIDEATERKHHEREKAKQSRGSS